MRKPFCDKCDIHNSNGGIFFYHVLVRMFLPSFLKRVVANPNKAQLPLDFVPYSKLRKHTNKDLLISDGLSIGSSLAMEICR